MGEHVEGMAIEFCNNAFSVKLGTLKMKEAQTILKHIDQLATHKSKGDGAKSLAMSTGPGGESGNDLLDRLKDLYGTISTITPVVNFVSGLQETDPAFAFNVEPPVVKELCKSVGDRHAELECAVNGSLLELKLKSRRIDGDSILYVELLSKDLKTSPGVYIYTYNIYNIYGYMMYMYIYIYRERESKTSRTNK